ATEIGLKCWLQNQTTSRTGKRTEFRGRPVPSTPDITTQQQEKVPPMFKKTLISLAVASSLGLTGCFDSGSTGNNANRDYNITDTTIDRSLVRPIFDPNPLSPAFSVPTHFDLLLLLGATQDATAAFTARAVSAQCDGKLNAGSVVAGQSVFSSGFETGGPFQGPRAELASPAVNPAHITGLAPDANQPKFRPEAVNVHNGVNNALRITPL